MPSLLLTLLTAASLLAHSVLGCCWHHAHGCESHHAIIAEAGHSRSHANAPRLPNDSGGPAGVVVGDEDERHEHGTPCDEPDCSFVKSPPCSIPAADALLSAFVAAPPVHPATTVRRIGAAEVAADGRFSGAALRAVLQTWLV